MNRIKVGFPARQQNITATQGDLSDAETATPTAAPQFVDAGTTDPRTWITRAQVPATDPFRFGVCWSSATPTPTTPGKRFAFGTTSDVSGNRFWTDGIPDGDTFASVGPWIGATVHLYGSDDGVFTYRGAKTVTGGATRPVGVPTGRTGYISGTSYTYTFPNWIRPAVEYGVALEGATIWFGVSAVDTSTGEEGAIGWASASVSPGDMSGAKDPVGTTAASGEVDMVAGSLDAPANVAASAYAVNSQSFNVTWDAVSGAGGYRVYYSWVDPTTLPDAPYLECGVGGPELRNGDLVVVAASDNLATDWRWVSPRTYNTGEADRYFPSPTAFNINRQNKPSLGQTWQCIAHGTRPFTDSGSHFARLSVDVSQVAVAAGSAASRALLARHYFMSGTGQNFYYIPKVGDTANIRIRLKASRPVVISATLFGFGSSVDGPYGENGRQTINVTTSWQTFTLTDTVAQTLGTTVVAGYWALLLDTTAETTDFTLDCDLCEFQYKEQDRTPFIHSYALAGTPAGCDVRDHGGVKTYPNWCSMAQNLDVPGRGHRGQISAQMFDRKTANAKCHLQFDTIAFSPDEILDFVKYMADPNDARRIAQGQVQPWTRYFGKITFEPMNEAWNGISAFWTFKGVEDPVSGSKSAGWVYGAYSAWLYDLIKTSPYYVEGEWEIYLGGWRNNVTNWNSDVLEGFYETISNPNEPAYITITTYIGGWEYTSAVMQNTESSYQNVLGSPQASLRPSYEDLIANKATYPNIRTGGYEGGPSYILDGLNGAALTAEQEVQQETVGCSMAMVTAALAAQCDAVSIGQFSKNNYFIANIGNTWAYSKESHWGGQTKGALRAHIALHEHMGDMRAATPLPVAMGTLGAFNNAGLPIQIEEAAVYAFQSVTYPGRWAVCAFNFSATDSKLLVAKMPVSSCTAASLVADPQNLRNHDRYSPGVRWFKNLPQVDGGSQTGTSLVTDRWAMPPIVGKTFTVEGVAGTYTITGVEGYESGSGFLTLDQSLAAAPADGAAITVTSGTVRGVPVVNGGGQSGAELYIRGGTISNDAEFTIAGDATVYTVESQRHFVATAGRLSFTPALDSSPADGALISYQDANVATNEWADATSVAFDFTPTSLGAIADLRTITFDDSIGLPETGIPPGNFAMLLLSGVVS